MAAKGQAAIVTGAASGIGRAMALGLLEAGIDVAAVDREAILLDELEEEAADREFAGSVHTVLADLSDPGSFDGIVAAVLRSFGKIDVLVNKCGDRPGLDPRRSAAQPDPLLGD